jgi:hypothetical protein
MSKWKPEADDAETEVLHAVNKGKYIAILEQDKRITFMADHYCDLVYMEASTLE